MISSANPQSRLSDKKMPGVVINSRPISVYIVTPNLSRSRKAPMKTPLVLTILTALLLAGCNTSGTSARIEEKSAIFAALTPEQQQAIQTGAINVGFTTDMVYLSLGQPSKIETKASADGPVTVWTYTRFYPTEGVAETWSASRLQPTKLQVFFYQDKVFDAALEQNRSYQYSDTDMDRLADHSTNRQTPGMIAAGITPNANPQVSHPPFVRQ